MRKKALVSIMVTLTAIVLLGCPDPVNPTTDTVINIAAIPGVAAPAFGATPVTTITETDQYTGIVSWNSTPATFAASTVYTATITLTAKVGFTLTGVAANSFMVEGATATNEVNSGVVTAVFPATGAVPDTVINIAAIPGVTAPVTGASPVTTIAETTQYTGIVSWSPSVSDLFVSNTNYTATITLTAKAGFTMTGVAADFFTVTGTTSDTNPVNSGVVTAVFSATTANLAAVTDYTGTGVGTLKAVQGGTFNNGTADMTVSSFRMSQYEITVEQFVAVTGLANPSSNFTSVVNGPVQKVNWYHALVFCNALSIKEGLTPVYTISSSTAPSSWGTIPTTSDAIWDAVTADWSANGYRLPTEAESQFAARGGNSSAGYTYSGSNTIGDVAWYTTNSSSTTHTVGTKAANELGLYDMSGNVMEWCWDRYDSYSTSAEIDYRGAASSAGRVMHGGSWYDSETQCTVAYRRGGIPYYRDRDIGFRVIRP